MRPTLYIIAGSNGSGKTTASMNILPGLLDCKEFVNADEIAKGLSPFKPEEVAVQAGKLFNIFISLVDYWSLYDNNFETKLIANSDRIVDFIKFAKIKESCQQKRR